MQQVYIEFDLPPGPERVVFHLKPGAISVTFDTFSVYTFELTGRLYGAFVGGRNYRRGMDNRVLEKGRVSQGGRLERVQRMLEPEEADAFLEGVRRRMERTGEALRGGACRVRRADGEDAVETAVARLERIAAWDRQAYERDRERFMRVYRPVGVLPPDQYMALVIQATQGCPWNLCTFCDFYRDREFRIRPGEELRAHIAAVRSFLGEGIGLRKSIFLGDANALTVPWKRLVETVEAVREALPALAAGGIYGFTDAFGAGLRSPEEIAWLARMGLRRVYIGLETGHDPLLALVKKQGTAADAVAAVRRLKAGGVQVGAIVMLGLGGKRFAEAHVRDTARALNAMGLDAGDVIYFSELVAPPELAYARQMADLGVRGLNGEEMEAQMAAMRAGLRFEDPENRPKLAAYDIQRFIY